MKSFYEKLYTEATYLENVNLISFFKDNGVPKLNNMVAEELEGPISITENKEILKRMKNNRSSIGLMVSLLIFSNVFFSIQLVAFVVRSINLRYTHGELPITQNKV